VFSTLNDIGQTVIIYDNCYALVFGSGGYMCKSSIRELIAAWL